MKSITDFFKHDLQAPLHNTVWSWGAVASDGKRQALRVWADQYTIVDGAFWMSVDYIAIPATQTSPGAPERRRHVDAMRAGVPTAGVIVTADDPSATPRTIKYADYHQLVVFAPEFMEIGNEVFARVKKKIAPTEFKKL